MGKKRSTPSLSATAWGAATASASSAARAGMGRVTTKPSTDPASPVASTRSWPARAAMSVTTVASGSPAGTAANTSTLRLGMRLANSASASSSNTR